MLLEKIKTFRRQYRWGNEISDLRRNFDAHRSSAVASSREAPIARLLILPSDPWTLVGAKGDEAMMQAAVSQLRLRNPKLSVGVVVATDAAAQAAMTLGFTPVNAWSDDAQVVIAQLDAFQPDGMVVLGADIMDGYYNPVTTARMLLAADIAASRGVRVAILGFSFNLKPNKLIQPVFDGLNDSLAVNVRDRISHERFQAFSRTPAKLVADMAFMLEADPTSAKLVPLAAWADARRQAGDTLIGFNIHPMLIRHATPEQVQTLIDSSVTALRKVAAHRKVSVMLISHDYRDKESDDVCLAPIHKALAVELGAHLLYPTERYSAAELKAMAGLMDGIVTGRMHLAIASLGMGTAVAGLTYQDKFQGLLAHFDYPQRYLLPPADTVVPEKLAAMMFDLIDNVATLRQTVGISLPKVKQASARNLEQIN